MSKTHNDNLRLLAEAPQIISRAVKAGWISYPAKQRFNEDGSPDPMLLEDTESNVTRHTPEAMMHAYYLRSLGLGLDATAKACNVPRGSIVYMISKGHELTLAKEREAAAQAAPRPEELQ
jgi:hypothetical protein